MQIERLFVKNFGPLCDIEIIVSDINIFIGPVSGGKGTTAKLLAIFKSGKLNVDGDLMLSFRKLLANYNIEFIIDADTFIRYEYGDLFYEIKRGYARTNYTPSIKDGQLNPIYIPTERIFFPTFSQSIFNFLTNNISLPKWLIEFGAEFEKARTVLNRFKIGFLKAQYVFSNGIDLVEMDNGNVIKLSQASSGMQSVIPLMLVVQHNTNTTKKNDDLFVIEEPELNLYPSSQKDLVEFIIGRINQSKDKLIVTTHSPYLLTAIDNLIQAGNVGKGKPQLRAQVEKLAPSSLWVDFDHVSCYFFDNGFASSTLDVEIKSIGPSNIDDVSTELSETFESLLTLKYAE